MSCGSAPHQEHTFHLQKCPKVYQAVKRPPTCDSVTVSKERAASEMTTTLRPPLADTRSADIFSATYETADATFPLYLSREEKLVQFYTLRQDIEAILAKSEQQLFLCDEISDLEFRCKVMAVVADTLKEFCLVHLYDQAKDFVHASTLTSSDSHATSLKRQESFLLYADTHRLLEYIIHTYRTFSDSVLHKVLRLMHRILCLLTTHAHTEGHAVKRWKQWKDSTKPDTFVEFAIVRVLTDVYRCFVVPIPSP